MHKHIRLITYADSKKEAEQKALESFKNCCSQSEHQFFDYCNLSDLYSTFKYNCKNGRKSIRKAYKWTLQDILKAKQKILECINKPVNKILAHDPLSQHYFNVIGSNKHAWIFYVEDNCVESCKTRKEITDALDQYGNRDLDGSFLHTTYIVHLDCHF
jgi:hypothetical protein